MRDDGENIIQRHRSRSWIRWLVIGLGTIFLLLTVFRGAIARAPAHSPKAPAVAGCERTIGNASSARIASHWADAVLAAGDLSFAQLSQYVGEEPGKLSGTVKNVDINLNGKLDQPWNWDGTINAEIVDMSAAGFAVDRAKVDLSAKDGRITVHEGRIEQGQNRIDVRGTINLQTKKGGAGETPRNLQISVDAPDLKKLTAFMSEPATGNLHANGNLKTENGTAELTLQANGEEIAAQGAKIGKLTADIAATKKMAPPKPAAKGKAQPTPQPIYEGVSSKIETNLDDVRYGDFVIDQVQGEVKSDGAKVSLSPLTVARKQNVLQVNGNLQLPASGEKLINQPADLQFSLRAPQLADYWASGAADKVTGELQGNGNVEIRNGVANGKVNLQGSQITAQGLAIRDLGLDVAIKNDTVQLTSFSATLSDDDYLKGNGTVKLKKPYPYEGTLSAHLGKLSTFAPLLASGEEKTELAGSLVVDWKGQGEVSTFKNSGDLQLKLENARFAELENLEAKVEAHYSPEQLQVPLVYLASDKLSLQTSMQAKDGRLEVSNLEIDQGKTRWATAYAAIPFYWSRLGSEKPLFPPSGSVQINFDSENLDIARLFQNFGAEPPVSGQLSVNLRAQGPLEQLQGNLDLRLQSLRADTFKELEPATINLGMRLQNNELRVDGKVQQARIQPVQIDARLPLNLSKLLSEKKLDERTPVHATVQMPASSVNFIRQFVPGLRQVDGTVALNVNVDGTVGNPALSGAANMHINVARFESPTLPALTDFTARLDFRDNSLRFDRFGGDLAGGPFSLSGSISFPSLTEPTFDLHLKANSVLVARNDNLTARVDADIKVEGPLNSATVSGQVLTTNSRFLKNIDIIPISLPGRPAPLPEPPSAAPELSFPDPPLRDWKFDLVIKSKNPFLIRGNLATGTAIVDMKMAGTGLHPQLQGQVRLNNFEATLPFSTLTIDLGFLYFDPDDPLNPRIEMQGTSLIQDYTIHVYIYGTALNPQATFSSEPPLPQEDIISLLATGVTRESLSSGNVLASRALLLLGKELYRKIFKKGGDEKPKSDSIFNRLSVEYSGADPRTGEQSATAKYRASDHVILIGDVGVAGGFRGIVKYVIRFR